MKFYSKKAINEIFGAKRGTMAPKKGTVLFDAITTTGTSEQVCRDEDGRYYLTAKAVEGESDARLGMGTYFVDGQITMPISREGALAWSEPNLCGDELAAARSEFGENFPETLSLVLEFGKGSSTDTSAPYERLCKIDAESFVLYSTDDSYPFCHGSTTLYQLAEDEAERFTKEVYVYYIPAETARRWAVSRGMDADTCEKVFGPSAA